MYEIFQSDGDAKYHSKYSYDLNTIWNLWLQNLIARIIKILVRNVEGTLN